MTSRKTRSTPSVFAISNLESRRRVIATSPSQVVIQSPRIWMGSCSSDPLTRPTYANAQSQWRCRVTANSDFGCFAEDCCCFSAADCQLQGASAIGGVLGLPRTRTRWGKTLFCRKGAPRGTRDDDGDFFR
jgi:hypothetical protein